MTTEATPLDGCTETAECLRRWLAARRRRTQWRVATREGDHRIEYSVHYVKQNTKYGSNILYMAHVSKQLVR